MGEIGLLCGTESDGLCHELGRRYELHVCALLEHDGAHECGCGHRWIGDDDA